MDAATIQTTRDFEAFLREHGFSRRRARAIASHGFQEPGHQLDAALKHLRWLTARVERALTETKTRVIVPR